MNDEIVCVVAFGKNTGYSGPSTSCDRADAEKYAKYYRSIGYKARIISYEELDELLEKEREKRMNNRRTKKLAV